MVTGYSVAEVFMSFIQVESTKFILDLQSMNSGGAWHVTFFSNKP